MPAAPAQKEKRHACIINLPDWRRITAPQKKMFSRSIRQTGNEPFAIVPISASNVKFPPPPNQMVPFPPPIRTIRVPYPCAPLVRLGIVRNSRFPLCGLAVGRDGRPPHPWGLPTLPARAAAPRCRAHHSCGLAVGRDVPIAPPCHRRGARLGIEHTLRVLHAAALSAARCAAGPRTRRDVIIAPPLRTQYSHAHYPSGAMVGRRASRLAPYRHYARDIRHHYTRNIRTRWLTAAPYRHYTREIRTQNSPVAAHHRGQWRGFSSRAGTQSYSTVPSRDGSGRPFGSGPNRLGPD